MKRGDGLSPLAARIEEAGAWPPGSRLLAACSGGPDSVALVLGLDELRRASRIDLVVAHVHHGLRGEEADAEALAVRDLAERLGLPHVERRRDAAAERARRRRGLEEAARAVRREALEEMRLETSCDLIALAHTMDDQAETLLLRLVRGAGADGLSGIPARNGMFVRPLLGFRRHDLRRVLLAAGLAWSSDPTNWAPSSARSLVRELVERLEVTLNEGFVERACETALLLREESAFLDGLAREALDPLLDVAPGLDGTGSAARLTSCAALQALPVPVARRAIRRFLRTLRPDAPPPSSDAVARVLRLAGTPGASCRAAHVGGIVVRRVGDALVAGAEDPWRAPSEPLVLDVPGSVGWGRDLIAARAVDPEDGTGVTSGRRVLLDAAKIHGSLVVRTRRPGDTMTLPGGRARRVGGVMASLGIPAGLRDRHPLACTQDGAIAWIAGHCVAEGYTMTATTRHAVELIWHGRSRT